MKRTPRSPEELHAVALDAAVHSLRAAGIDAEATGPSEIRVDVDGLVHELRIEAVAYATAERVRELVGGRDDRSLVVADKITADGRTVLTDAGWSWLDLRGRLHVHAPGIRVDVDVPGQLDWSGEGSAGRAIAGRSGLTVAYWLCEHPGEVLSPTRDAVLLGLAPSTISTTVRRLADAGLVDRDGTGVLPELFWELAAAWQPERRWLLGAPVPARPGRPEADGPGWRRTGTPAAVAYGAPVVSTGGEPVDLYVPSTVDVSIAVRQLGSAQPGQGAASIMVAPVRAVTAPGDGRPVLDGWTAAPALAVALDLAQDRARGREILEGWETPDAVWR